MATANYILINGKHYSPNHPLAIAWMRQNRSETNRNASGGIQTPPKPSKRLKHEDSTDCPPSHSESEQAFSVVAVGSASGKGQNAPRIGVHITSYRKRLLDTDNLVGGSKFFVDGLRYLRLIPGDRADQITLTVEQRLCKDERTEIEIEYP